jgi:uncharacterized protein (TIGR03067 family)
MRKVAGLLVLACVVMLGAEEAKKDAKSDLKKLDGSWKAVKLIYNGEDFMKGEDSRIAMDIKDGVATVRASEGIKKEYAKVRLVLDPSATPKLLDLTVVAGAQKDAKMEGIYKLDGDKLTICVKVLGNGRPAKFESPEGESIALLELTREK